MKNVAGGVVKALWVRVFPSGARGLMKNNHGLYPVPICVMLAHFADLEPEYTSMNSCPIGGER